MLLETGIFASQAIWLWRVRHIRRQAKKVGKTYDEYIAECPSKILPRSDSSETVVDVEACHEPQDQDASSKKLKTESIKTSDTTTESSQEKVSTPKHGLLQKWRSMVLRPVDPKP